MSYTKKSRQNCGMFMYVPYVLGNKKNVYRHATATAGIHEIAGLFNLFQYQMPRKKPCFSNFSIASIVIVGDRQNQAIGITKDAVYPLSGPLQRK